MTCDTALSMEVACDESKKPFKISLPNVGKYHTQHGQTQTKNSNQQKPKQKQNKSYLTHNTFHKVQNNIY